MRKVFTVAAIAAIAGALASCEPEELVVSFSNGLESVSLVASHPDSRWEWGEERTVTVMVSPATAMCGQFELHVSNPEIASVRAGELPNQFRVTATGAGPLVVTGTAVGHSAASMEERVEKSASLEFRLEDNRVVPTRPVVAVTVAPGTDITQKRVLCEDEAFRTDAGQTFMVSVSSDAARATYSLRSADEKVLALERSGTAGWVLRTGQPGRTWLLLSVKDAAGNSFEYGFLLYVFGHLTLEAEYHPIAGKAGLTVQEHPYTDLQAQVFLSGQIYGRPWNDEHNVVVREIPTFNGVIDITRELDHWNLVDASAVQAEIQEMIAGEGLNKAWFAVREAKLNYVISLSNPYVIIDALVDDTFRKETRYWDFYYEGNLQQEGLAEVENPEIVIPL